MSVACLAFTDKGFALAQTLARALGGTADRSGQPLSLDQWTRQHFDREKALIYVGAAGIAVRAVAPFLQSKTTDPAVVVVDECGQFAIPIVAGHLGGANALARRVGQICGAVPVITTATDVNGVFAIDTWARSQGCVVLHPGQIRKVSGCLLAGKTVRLHTQLPVSGTLPQGIQVVQQGPWQVYLGVDPQPENVLWLVPRCIVLGIGCRKGISAQVLEEQFAAFGLPPQVVLAVASIDLKAEESGLLAFCRQHGWPLQVYTAEELAAVPGTFSASSFVAKTTGVDNVCERAAVLASGGKLLRGKTAGDGVTLAAAVAPLELDWRTNDEW